MYVRKVKYSSPSERMFAPRQRISPFAGGASPHRIRSRLVLPLPFAPVSCKKPPGLNEKLRPLKSRRSPRIHSRLMVSSTSAPGFEICRHRRHLTWQVAIIADDSAACHGRLSTPFAPGDAEDSVLKLMQFGFGPRLLGIPGVFRASPKEQSRLAGDRLLNCITLKGRQSPS